MMALQLFRIYFELNEAWHLHHRNICFVHRTGEAETFQSSVNQQFGIIYEKKKKCNISLSSFQLKQIENKVVQINSVKRNIWT